MDVMNHGFSVSELHTVCSGHIADDLFSNCICPQGSGLYGGGLYGGTLPTYDSTAEFSSKYRRYGGTLKMRTSPRSFSKNTYPTACGPRLSLYIYIFTTV